MKIEELKQKVETLLDAKVNPAVKYNPDVKYNMSGVATATYLKEKLGVGRLCTVRAFTRAYEPPGVMFLCPNIAGCAPTFVAYHTVLWYKHAGGIYIIDGTADIPVRTLGQYACVLGQLNNRNGDCPQFVFYTGVVDDEQLKNSTHFRCKRLFSI